MLYSCTVHCTDAQAFSLCFCFLFLPPSNPGRPVFFLLLSLIPNFLFRLASARAAMLSVRFLLAAYWALSRSFFLSDLRQKVSYYPRKPSWVD